MAHFRVLVFIIEAIRDPVAYLIRGFINADSSRDVASPVSRTDAPEDIGLLMNDSRRGKKGIVGRSLQGAKAFLAIGEEKTFLWISEETSSVYLVHAM